MSYPLKIRPRVGRCAGHRRHRWRENPRIPGIKAIVETQVCLRPGCLWRRILDLGRIYGYFRGERRWKPGEL